MLSKGMGSKQPPHSTPNLIRIRSLTFYPCLICCVVGDLRTPQHGSYASDLMSSIYKDLIKTAMTFSANRIARSMKTRLLAISRSSNRHFHWMVYKVTRV